ncbi:type II secretion system protein GspD [Psychroserpens sp. SPM9]|uniref:type II secretion system protein GspD n=1 Tax=Psychroserpens sp. SPM9 TaxID=2975598 RepID=UPI0021A68715|nr:general secretion pathway protein GspD [Psychroserpens sp. SPM9]MDG5490646.1 general secretion pathway protein GspD [Psychroserpens sp. SPM9]
MKSILSIILIFLALSFGQAQTNDRLLSIGNKLDSLSVTNSGLIEQLDASISLNEVSLSSFLLAVSNVHNININVSPELNQIKITNNFSDVTVSDVLVFLCKEHQLTIEFTGSILSIKTFNPIKEDTTYPIGVDYNPSNETIAIDTRENDLYEVFKHIMDASAKNLMFAPGMEHLKLTSYIKTTDFDAAMQNMALSNDLILTKTKDNFYVFDNQITSDVNKKRSIRNRLNPNLSFKVLNKNNKLLEVDFSNSQIADVIKTIADSLDINMFLASPLEESGTVTLKTKSITFDDLLIKMFEPQVDINPIDIDNSTTSSNGRNNSSELTNPISKNYTFKKEGNIYFFGTANQLSVRKVEIITLKHRSVNLMSDPESMSLNNNVRDNFIAVDQGYRNQINYNSSNGSNINNRQQNSNNRNRLSENQEAQSILDIVPEEIKYGLDFKVDFELNNIYVTGTSARIEFFKDFIRNIDKTVPVILIEVMIVEAQTTNTLEAGVSWGIGNEPQVAQGGIFPSTDLTLGAQTINKIINGFSDTSVFNFGRVVPNFFATIKAMETNGDLKIKSTPKLATLNGHRASFSNGQTSYYAIVQRNIIGTDNPQTSEIRNYFPIDAKLGLDIKPYVTGDKQVLLDINVIQSSFGQRIADDAPPDINSRNFSSIVRMKDQDIAVLGGLEENYKNNSGSGVPFLARIPIIKWLFSKRVREGRKSKLTVFIKPTIIN